MVPEMFRVGSPVVLREVVNGKVWTVRPVRVVRDTPELTALYMVPGSSYKHPRTLTGNRVPRHLLVTDWRLIDRRWDGGGALYLATPGDPYMIIGFRTDDNSGWEQWYINLQDPLMRTTLGFDYLDMELDVEIKPDLTEWRWKDVARFRVLVDRGVISPTKAAQLTRVGQKIADMVVSGASIVDGWQRWDPPQWHIAPMPEDWDEISRARCQ